MDISDKFRPLADNVFVKLAEKSAMSQGGILIADTAHEVQNKGYVIAVGPGKTLKTGVLVESTVKPGDAVVFDPKAGHTARIEGVELLVLKEDQIFAVVE